MQLHHREDCLIDAGNSGGNMRGTLGSSSAASGDGGEGAAAGLARKEALGRGRATVAYGAQRRGCTRGRAAGDRHNVVGHLPALRLQRRWRQLQPRLAGDCLQGGRLSDKVTREHYYYRLQKRVGLQ